MDIKYELLADSLADVVYKKIEDAFDNLKDWTETTSMVMLFEIWGIITDKHLSESEVIEQIKEVYKKHNVDCNVHSI